jgi:hypothetical protein
MLVFGGSEGKESVLRGAFSRNSLTNQTMAKTRKTGVRPI